MFPLERSTPHEDVHHHEEGVEQVDLESRDTGRKEAKRGPGSEGEDANTHKRTHTHTKKSGEEHDEGESVACAVHKGRAWQK